VLFRSENIRGSTTMMISFGAATILVMIVPCTRARSAFTRDNLLNTNTLHRLQSKARIVQDDFDFFRSTDDLGEHDDDDDDDKATLVELPRNDVSFGRVFENNLKVIRADELQLSFSSPAVGVAAIDAPIARSFRSTGTTICGCLVGQFVILGADTRATDDRMVADKRCEKIHKLARNMYACGAGTSADLDMVTRQVEYKLRLQQQQELSIGNTPKPASNEPSVSGACRMLRDTLFEGGGEIGANLILGGHENGKAVLVAIHPHGSMDVVPFSALGSGGLAAMAVLELGYTSELTLEQGKDLVKRAIMAGIKNDLGSGSQVDLLVLGPNDFVDYQRGVIPEEQGELRRQVEMMSDGQGVNGFGNSPHKVQAQRVMLPVKESNTTQKWKELLDF